MIFGHTPFGHAGERALNRVMQPFGGFDHNAQSMHIVTSLEQRYAEYDGLNLTWETVEGLVKHNGPLLSKDLLSKDKPLYEDLLSTLPYEIIAYNEKTDLELSGYASAEAQVAAIADDIAYNNHDLDDGLRAGLYELAELEDMPLVAAMIEEVRTLYPDLAEHRFIYEINRRLITAMVNDVVCETTSRIAQLKPRSCEDIHAASRQVVAFSSTFAEGLTLLRKFLFKRVYHHKDIVRIMDGAETIVEDLGHYYLKDSQRLPPEWSKIAIKGTALDRARVVKDFVAGMTDMYALKKHREIFDHTPELR